MRSLLEASGDVRTARRTYQSVAVLIRQRGKYFVEITTRKDASVTRIAKISYVQRLSKILMLLDKTGAWKREEFVTNSSLAHDAQANRDNWKESAWPRRELLT